LHNQCAKEAGHKKSLAVRISRLTVRGNSFEMEAQSDWTETQVLDGDGNFGKSPSCLPNQIISTNSLMFLEQLGLELEPQVDETPLKGGLGVKVIHKRYVCPTVNDLGVSLEGVGCLVDVVRDNFPKTGAGLGEENMLVYFVEEI